MSTVQWLCLWLGSNIDIAGGDSEIYLQVLNELVLDRGMSPFLTSLDCYCDDTYVSNVQVCHLGSHSTDRFDFVCCHV